MFDIGDEFDFLDEAGDDNPSDYEQQIADLEAAITRMKREMHDARELLHNLQEMHPDIDEEPEPTDIMPTHVDDNPFRMVEWQGRDIPYCEISDMDEYIGKEKENLDV